MPTQKRSVQKDRLAQLRAEERVISKGIEEFARVGVALKRIMDQRLYQADGYDSFAKYCKDRWGYAEMASRQLIRAAEVRLVLPTGADGAGEWKERQIRPLTRLPTTGHARKVAKKVLAHVEKEDVELTGPLFDKFVREELGQGSAPKRPRPPRKTHVQQVRDWISQLDQISRQLDGVPEDSWALFGEDHPVVAEEFAELLDRVKDSCTRVWEALP